MLQILISCLVISSALATSLDACNAGPVSFTGFDIDKYLGKWYELYRIPNAAEENLTCEAELYFKTENGIGIQTIGYNNRTRISEGLNGRAQQWMDNGFSEIYFDNEYWTNYYWVLGTDYKTYSILRTCLPRNKEQSTTWVFSRSTAITEETKQEVNNILKNFDLSLDDFEPVSQVDCS